MTLPRTYRDLLKLQFESASQSPGAWLVQAARLREASKCLDWIFDPESVEPVGFMIEYRLLLSLSMENLIKGILIAHRLRSGEVAFDKNLFSHNLVFLAKKLPSSVLPLSENESKSLEDLTQYIEWAGRYPFPKSEANYFTLMHSGTQRDTELRLWSRLFSHLGEIAWFVTGVPNESGWYYLLTRGVYEA